MKEAEEARREQRQQAIAAVMDRIRSYVINEAITAYLEMHKWQIEEIKKASLKLRREILQAKQ